MKILVTGADGQLGTELHLTRPQKHDCRFAGRKDLDITSSDSLDSAIAKYGPEIIINTAAFTAVDDAEDHATLAYSVNAYAVQSLAVKCKERGIRLIHISTDFVFSGNQLSPYTPDTVPDPVCIYGKSKAEGENLLLSEYAENSIILRTSWLYSSHGDNFVKTMLKLMNDQVPLRVVCDQTGSPTWAKGIAQAIWSLCEIMNLSGILHWSDDGAVTWYDFACMIQKEAFRIGLLEKVHDITPVSSSEYPTRATRPAYSVLDNQTTWDIIGYRSNHWQNSLVSMLLELKQ